MQTFSKFLLVSMLLFVLAPVAALAQVTTGLTRDSGGGAAPIIKTKWEMNGPWTALKGTDDAITAGAQFKAPGVWDATMQYSVCAVVTDPDGVADINAVYADIYYPTAMALHESVPTTDVINGGTTANPDYGQGACGNQIGDEAKLTKLPKMDGYNLFCDTIKNHNNNLPTFSATVYTYNEICAADGELMKETASVYCADRTLRWEDPAGTYKITVFSLDKAGVFSNLLENNFTYLPLTAYAVDFTNVNYGLVKLNTHKLISGDLTFGTAAQPTVRNIGNTRLYMGVKQNDMGLGTTDGVYNVKYDGRVGNAEADWKNYWPESHVWFEDILDLSETEEMDFSILITKFPAPSTTYTGTMILDAKMANFRMCGTR